MRAFLPLAVLVASAASHAAAAGGWTVLPSGQAGGSGHRAASHRIFNGEPTGAFPAVAGLVIFRGDGAVGLCSGTLVTPDVIVTAAHCLLDGPARVVAAFFADGATEVDYDVVAYAIHPDFDPAVLAYADIALVAVDRPVAGVPPMPLAAAKPRPRTRGIIVGYGQDEAGNVGAKEMGTVRLKPCPRIFRRAGIGRGQLAGSLCWRPRKRGHDTCQGDSGGPLIIGGDVAGVTSGGYPRCPGRLSWDTSVAAFRSWIDLALTERADRP